MKKKILFIFCCLTLIFAACDNDNSKEPEPPVDPNFEEKEHLYIEYTNSTVIVDKEIEGVAVKIEGTDIEVSSTVEGIKFTLTGSTSNGSFKVYSTYSLELNLDGVSISKTNGPAINIQSEQPAIITLKEGTTSTLQDGASYSASDEDMKGALTSTGQINIKGTGELTITGNCKHGISSNTHILIEEACTIKVINAASDAIHSKYDTHVNAGVLILTSVNEGIESKSGKVEINGGEINIVTTGEKSDGIKADSDITIKGGIIEILTEGEASKCVKTDGNIMISDAKLLLTTKGGAIYDDGDTSSSSGLRSKGDISIENAEVIMKSSGDGGKGMSGDKNITITSGTISVETTGGQFVYNTSLTSSPKAIKSEGSTTIKGGRLSILTTGVAGEGIDCKGVLMIENGEVIANCYDDCLKTSNNFVMNNGYVYCKSVTNDGVDSKGTITINGGQIIAVGAAGTREGFNCSKNNFEIKGGIVVGVGGKSSTPTNGTTQYTVLYKGRLNENDIVHIQSDSETGIFTYTTPINYSSAILLVSTPGFAENTSYSIYKGGEVTSGTETNGYYSGEVVYESGEMIHSFITNKLITVLN